MMFHINHSINATQLIKNFTELAKYVQDMKPILVIQRNGAKMVLLTADMYEAMIFDDLASARCQQKIPFLNVIVANKNC